MLESITKKWLESQASHKVSPGESRRIKGKVKSFPLFVYIRVDKSVVIKCLLVR